MNTDAVLRSTGLQPPTDRPLPAGLTPAAWGRSGDKWVFWFENPTATELLAALERVREHVNVEYPWPRAIRFFSVPHMVLVGVVDQPDPALDAAVRDSGTSSWMGGELWSLVSVTRSTGAMVFPEPKGNRNHKLVEKLRLSKLQPDRYALAAISAR